MSSLGFKATEADDNLSKLSTVYARETKQFRDRLAKHGMQMVALYHNLPVDEAARFDEGVAEGMVVGKFMHDTGISIFNLSGGTRKPGGNPPEDFKALARLVNELGKRLKEQYGIQLGYHPHTNNMIENRAEIGRMMEMTDPRYFNLNPDTGHLLAGGSDPLEVFRTYQSRIAYLHFKDWDPNMVTRADRADRTQGRISRAGRRHRAVAAARRVPAQDRLRQVGDDRDRLVADDAARQRNERFEIHDRPLEAEGRLTPEGQHVSKGCMDRSDGCGGRWPPPSCGAAGRHVPVPATTQRRRCLTMREGHGAADVRHGVPRSDVPDRAA